MIVVKQGKKNPRKFTCVNCDCEFIADNTEYFRFGSFGVISYECNCPCCTYTSSTSEPMEEQ